MFRIRSAQGIWMFGGRKRGGTKKILWQYKDLLMEQMGSLIFALEKERGEQKEVWIKIVDDISRLPEILLPTKNKPHWLMSNQVWEYLLAFGRDLKWEDEAGKLCGFSNFAGGEQLVGKYLAKREPFAVLMDERFTFGESSMKVFMIVLVKSFKGVLPRDIYGRRLARIEAKLDRDL